MAIDRSADEFMGVGVEAYLGEAFDVMAWRDVLGAGMLPMGGTDEVVQAGAGGQR